MIKRVAITVFAVIFLSGCSLHANKSMFEYSFISKELLKDWLTKGIEENCAFMLSQHENNQVNVFKGQQQGKDWILTQGHKKIYIEKKGNSVILSTGNERKILPKDQFGIISPFEHLNFVVESGKKIEQLPNTTLNGRKVSRIKVTINEEKLVHILESRYKMSSTKPLSGYIRGRMHVTYDLFFSPYTKDLLSFTTSISTSEGKENCRLVYTFP